MQDNDTPLIWASRNGRDSVVKLLLDKGADIHHANKVILFSLFQ